MMDGLDQSYQTTNWKNQLESYRGCLTGYALFLTRNREIASDLVQDTFLRAITKSHLFHYQTTEKDLIHWLCTIMHNLNIDRVHKEEKYNKRWVNIDTMANTLCDINNNTSIILELHEVLDNIEKLSEKQSKIIQLSVSEGLSYYQISKLLEMPVYAVRAHLARGRSALRELVDRPAKHIKRKEKCQTSP